MQVALPLWGFKISAYWAVGLIAGYLILSLLAIILIPRWVVRAPADNSLDAQGKLFDLRAKVRQATIQVIGAVTVVLAVLGTLQQLRGTEDAFNEKKADLFVKSLSMLQDPAAAANKKAEALYLLSFVARSDPTYHRTVFDSISNYIVSLSGPSCQNVFNKKTVFQRNPQIQMAMRIIGERNPTEDPTGKRFNLEHTCLVEVDMRDEYGVIIGLRKARLSSSLMLRNDFTKADLSGADLQGIEASDYRNPDWNPEIGYKLHRGEEDETRGLTDSANGDVRRKYITHFTDANLTDADLSGAQLTGADFAGATLTRAKFDRANISRANFNGAQNLTAEQLAKACVGKASMTPAELAKEQPYLWRDLRKNLPTGIKTCQ